MQLDVAVAVQRVVVEREAAVAATMGTLLDLKGLSKPHVFDGSEASLGGLGVQVQVLRDAAEPRLSASICSPRTHQCKGRSGASICQGPLNGTCADEFRFVKPPFLI